MWQIAIRKYSIEIVLCQFADLHLEQVYIKIILESFL